MRASNNINSSHRVMRARAICGWRVASGTKLCVCVCEEHTGESRAHGMYTHKCIHAMFTTTANMGCDEHMACVCTMRECDHHMSRVDQRGLAPVRSFAQNTQRPSSRKKRNQHTTTQKKRETDSIATRRRTRALSLRSLGRAQTQQEGIGHLIELDSSSTCRSARSNTSIYTARNPIWVAAMAMANRIYKYRMIL